MYNSALFYCCLPTLEQLFLKLTLFVVNNLFSNMTA